MKGYRINWPDKTNAAEVLDFEFHELGNTHLLGDVVKFLGIDSSWLSKKDPWAVVISVFKSRYGDASGVWLTRSKEAAIEYYGSSGIFPVEGDLLVYEYDPALIVSDLGEDGIFVLNPKFISSEDRNGWRTEVGRQ
jgi:hypothetical protein